MSEDRILGTRVPDTPIHRASMWLEDLKFGERRKEAGAEPMGELWQRFVTLSEASFTPEQLQEAADYYGTNNAAVLTGGRLEVTIPAPGGEGVMFLRDIFASLWADAFMHGHATAQGRRGLSNQEIAEQ